MSSIDIENDIAIDDRISNEVDLRNNGGIEHYSTEDLDNRAQSDEQGLLLSQGQIEPIPPRAPMMVTTTSIPRRVKVYELRNEVWADRGTGFCVGQYTRNLNEGAICVKDEDDESRILLDSRISEEDVYNKQQDTLIVWTEPDATDMALSFQESEGCMEIMEFIGHVRARYQDPIMSDEFSEHIIDTLALPEPQIGNLSQIEMMLRHATETTGPYRNRIIYLIQEDHMRYIEQLLDMLSVLEDLESLHDLHRLCNIVKSIIMFSEVPILEMLIQKKHIFTVAGSLEYDPDFPTYKANHRAYLSDPTKFRQVVEIPSPSIREKIHQTFRLQYFKDVALARFLEDPAFNILNSLIYYNQVDIITKLQHNATFFSDLFTIFRDEADEATKHQALQFIQQFCSVAKTLQGPSRSQLYSLFVAQGIFDVCVVYAMKQDDLSIRTAGMDVLGAIIEHDPSLIRGYMTKEADASNNGQISLSEQGHSPLMSLIIKSFAEETNTGLRSQLAEAMRVMLDPAAILPPEGLQKHFGQDPGARPRLDDPETERFLQWFYDSCINDLVKPIINLPSESDSMELAFDAGQVALFNHLCDLLCFFIRAHSFRAKAFMLSSSLPSKVALLLRARAKHLKLAALRFFRTCIGVKDEFYNRHLVKASLWTPIVNVLLETEGRNNLINSACLELFDFIRKENIKPIILHLAENYGEQLRSLPPTETLNLLLQRSEQYLSNENGLDMTQGATESAMNQLTFPNGDNRWSGAPKQMEPEEESYFDTSDEDEETNRRVEPQSVPLVCYGSDEEEAETVNATLVQADEQEEVATAEVATAEVATAEVATAGIEIESLPSLGGEKRRRDEEEDDDTLLKLARNSPSHISTSSEKRRATSPQGPDKSGKKIAISLGSAKKTS